MKSTMKKTPAIKHQAVRDALIEAIQRGDFKPGDRLPAERVLAEIYGVSYMTARRAVTEMVESDLLLRRARSGTYVPEHTPRHVASTTLHLVCPASESSGIRAFVRLGTQAAEARGWRADVIRLHAQQMRPALRHIQNGDFTVVLPSGAELEGPLRQAMIEAKGRAIVLGNRLDQVGVPSIIADDARGIQLAMEHFQSKGHRNIAVVTAGPGHAVDRVQLQAWEKALSASLSADQISKMRIAVQIPPHQSGVQYTHAAVVDYLRHDEGQTTAILCLNDDMVLPALTACREAGRPVPEKMAMIASGNGSAMAYTHPPMTCIDIHMEEHIAQAMELIDAAQQKRAPTPLLRLVTPHLVERQSVGPV